MRIRAAVMAGSLVGSGCLGPTLTDDDESETSTEGSGSGDSVTDPTLPPPGTAGEDGDPGGTTGAGTTGAETTGPVAVCGDGQVDPGEECDGAQLQGGSCEALGHVPGTLACTASCTYDISGCIPPGMVYVPGGPFEMGSDMNLLEQPVRMVDVDAFYIDQTEVTVEAYVDCMDAGACTNTQVGGNFNLGVPGREQHPINGTTWFQAEAYCAWVDGGVKRMPTEAEWEKAARGTDARTYPWGDAPEASCTHAIMDDEFGVGGCGTDLTAPVGSRPGGASPYGALDMSGNVYEWVHDFWDYYDPADLDNPTGPVTGDMRVARGGSFSIDNPTYMTATYRPSDSPEQQYYWVGFRCVRPAPAP